MDLNFIVSPGDKMLVFILFMLKSSNGVLPIMFHPPGLSKVYIVHVIAQRRIDLFAQRVPVPFCVTPQRLQPGVFRVVRCDDVWQQRPVAPLSVAEDGEAGEHERQHVVWAARRR